MEKGFVYYKRPTLAPDLYNYVWFNAMVGKSNVLNESEYNSLPVWKRGLIHTPSLRGATIQENGSFFRELLDQLTISAVNQGAPVLIDMFEGDVAYRINGQLGLVFEYVGYIHDHWGVENKPLLRLNQGQWNAYCTDNLKLTLGLLDTVDVLVVSPNAAFPPTWEHLPEVNWFEYYTGIIAHDSTGDWLESPSNPDVIDPPVDPPVVDPPVDPPVTPTTSLEGWKMKFTGKVGRNDVDVTGEFFKDK